MILLIKQLIRRAEVERGVDQNQGQVVLGHRPPLDDVMKDREQREDDEEDGEEEDRRP